MNCAVISETIGYPCYPINDEDTLAAIDIPFTFADGDDIPAYIELVGGSVRFLDCGELFDHFDARGISLENEKETEFLSAIAASKGISFSDTWEIEMDATLQEAAGVFAQYVDAMLAFVSWEKEWEECERGEMPILMLK